MAKFWRSLRDRVTKRKAVRKEYNATMLLGELQYRNKLMRDYEDAYRDYFGEDTEVRYNHGRYYLHGLSKGFRDEVLIASTKQLLGLIHERELDFSVEG